MLEEETWGGWVKPDLLESLVGKGGNVEEEQGRRGEEEEDGRAHLWRLPLRPHVEAPRDRATLHPLPQAQPDVKGGRLGQRVHVQAALILGHPRGDRDPQGRSQRP